MPFWRREPLHERLAREGGLGPRPVDTGPRWGEVGIHGVSRPREWDAVATVETELEGAEARFVALPDGTLLVESGPDDVAVLAEAVERSLPPPYRAEAVRRTAEAWAVAARRIRVVDLPDQDGEEVDLTTGPDGRRLLVDGETRFGASPALEQLVDGDGHVRAARLDGTLWEVAVSRL
jgi:hypothetical protein